MASATGTYKVFTAEYLGSPNHVGIYVNTDGLKGGQIYHVVGTVLNGMTYETKHSKDPEESATFVPDSMVYVGQISHSDLDRLDQACRAIEPPGKQLRLNGSRIDPSKALRRCGEWVEEVKEKILKEALVVPE